MLPTMIVMNVNASAVWDASICLAKYLEKVGVHLVYKQADHARMREWYSLCMLPQQSADNTCSTSARVTSRGPP